MVRIFHYEYGKNQINVSQWNQWSKFWVYEFLMQPRVYKATVVKSVRVTSKSNWRKLPMTLHTGFCNL